jgi:amidase
MASAEAFSLMPDTVDMNDSPLFWPISRLVDAYKQGELSPVEVTDELISRIDRFNPDLNAYITRLDDLARQQASAAEQAYRDGEAGPLGGVPVSIKDTFAVTGELTTYGSHFYRDNVSGHDSGLIKRLRNAGSVFAGKTNTAEFGQSATTDNHLLPDTANAWDPSRTPGGSSGGAASSVAAGLATVGLGADGGGSIRIPAAFSGLFGFKPTHGLCADENGSVAMTEFVCPGPLARCVQDARTFLEVIAEQSYARKTLGGGLKIGWCPAPEGRAVDPAVADSVYQAVLKLQDMGHEIIETDLPINNWKDIFGPLVLAVESRERGHLLDEGADLLTEYERATLEAALTLTHDAVERATRELEIFRQRMDGFFDGFDAVVTPATATTAFELGQRPTLVDGRPVSELWGAFPFTSPFNVAGTPGASIPCGLVEGMPVGIQVIAAQGRDQFVLDLSQNLEESLAFDHSYLQRKWSALEIQNKVSG